MLPWNALKCLHYQDKSKCAQLYSRHRCTYLFSNQICTVVFNTHMCTVVFKTQMYTVVCTCAQHKYKHKQAEDAPLESSGMLLPRYISYTDTVLADRCVEYTQERD